MNASQRQPALHRLWSISLIESSQPSAMLPPTIQKATSPASSDERIVAELQERLEHHVFDFRFRPDLRPARRGAARPRNHPDPKRKRFLKRLWLETRKLTDRPAKFQFAGSVKTWWARNARGVLIGSPGCQVTRSLDDRSFAGCQGFMASYDHLVVRGLTSRKSS